MDNIIRLRAGWSDDNIVDGYVAIIRDPRSPSQAYDVLLVRGAVNAERNVSHHGSFKELRIATDHAIEAATGAGRLPILCYFDMDWPRAKRRPRQ